MNLIVDYNSIFNKALNHIKSIRAPHAGRVEDKFLQWDIVEEQALLKLGGKDFDKMMHVYESAMMTSVSSVLYIIQQLLLEYEYDVENIPYDKNDSFFERTFLILKDCKRKCLLVFRDIEESSMLKRKGSEPPEVEKIMKDRGCESCNYIYFMNDLAYLQLMDYNDDMNDPGRGYNLYSLKWFFETYFNAEEYNLFYKNFQTYISDVETYIGYTTTKILIPGALNNFKRIIERTLVNYSYNKLLAITYNKKHLQQADFQLIKKQFLSEKTLLTMVGKRDFAMSLLTAEWLYDSMKKAKAIDLTVIGMGYFKAVEQLIFDLICLHKNEGFLIKKDYSKKELPSNIELNDKNIKDKAIDATLGSMAVFIRNEIQTLFRSDITEHAKKYVREAVFQYTDLRNGFFHKDNIRQIEKIEEIRDQSFYMFFLLLGSFSLSESNLKQLGYLEEEITDYYRLCEYVDFHSDNVFVVSFLGDKQEHYMIACPDRNIKTDENDQIHYSGVYFKKLGQSECITHFPENNLPNEIYLGKFDLKKTDSDSLSLTISKVVKIFENGKYVGPKVNDEKSEEY